MSGWHLVLRQAPAVRVDLRGVLPSTLAGLSTAAVGQLPVGHGKTLVPLGEFFDVRTHGYHDTLTLEGDLSRFDRVGWQMTSGHLTVDGNAGHYAGGGMSGGELHVKGAVGLLAGCEMAGGRLTVDGSAGDFAAGPLPGSMDGMRGGTLIVKGDAGDRFGDRMRRGTALVYGNAGDFLASRMVAGTIGLGGRAGAHVGYGMRRGSVVFAGAAPDIAATFVPALAEGSVFWQLLAKDLAQHGGPFERLPSRSIERHLGDLAADGRGEIIVVR